MAEHTLDAQTLYQARKARTDHPKGTFDKAGRFWPSEEEIRPCCATIRTPSRAYPYSLMTHARTLRHCRNLCN
jgi:hypothetical protein